ncbi:MULTISPECIES: low molecular weight protein-tyrosine-phosphatase [unclassified Empedobacter]|uniref:low molecular weight protein-tyrosine-phosphatase n=1 Tax=unclassified Empedobacter TaxID=2643773 RepID=UPI001D781524|nr:MULTISPECIES: low molecular weight protein-tyrosine-phosphatase [unclassified Empedobacter]MDM1523139.1 low molecular weight phosphotyrosine protein phosphatase [Empedobacter sp. 225-1]MDM1542605.1 low molecular weight phosphotyrosine protein phosphatase [Empedobacter sp. 189-2]HJD86956.1 low molecular weight phosphotyrosine protein phosphatase [Empedobacter falsenii]
MKILMVCLGNICRSPLAEGILQAKVGDNHLVDSAGTGNWHVGEQPDRRSVAVAKKYGVDISDQRAMHFNLIFFEEFDLIFAMDKQNSIDLQQLARNEEEKEKVKLILKEGTGLAHNVPDPYYDGEDAFEHVYQLLDEATDGIIKKYNL